MDFGYLLDSISWFSFEEMKDLEESIFLQVVVVDETNFSLQNVIS